MRKLLIATTLTLALLGAMGLGSARSLAGFHALTAHTQLLASSATTPYTPVCPGGSSTSCG